MTCTEDLVNYIVNADEESLPREVVEHTKTFILDTLGCAIGGYCTKPGRQVVA